MNNIKEYMNKIGAKYYKYVEGEEQPEVIRIYKVDEVKKTITVFDTKNKKCKINIEDIEEYRQIAPDGVITFSIVKVNGGISDVLVALGRLNSDKNDNGLPYAVCRQMITDVFSNMSSGSIERGNIFVGMSISQDTCPADIDFKDVLSCSELTYNRAIYVYLDDTIDIILKLIPSSKFDSVLRISYSNNYTIENYTTYGYVDSLKSLLEQTNFMYDFKKAFDIVELPYEIIEDDESLSYDNTMFLENFIKSNIERTYVIRFTKEINLNSIKRDYILASSASELYSKVYIVAFDKVDDIYIAKK